MRSLFILLYLLAVAGARCQIREIPEWTLSLRVIDEDRQPVKDATIKVSWHVPPPEGQNIAFTNLVGRTRDDGTFVTKQRSGSIEVMFGASKEGYYSNGRDHEFAKIRDGDPAKWNPSTTLLLKKIKQPVDMYAKQVNLGLPTRDKAVGFDLAVGDWVAPHGKGVTVDVLFNGHVEKKGPDSDYTLVVSFPSPGDGIQEFVRSEAEFGSSLGSPQMAPLEGYASQWVQTDFRSPGKPIRTNRDEKRIYLLRVRTILDEQGKVKSAQYAKVYGDFMQFSYYLNPTPNSRSLEFNRGLIKGLKSFENVSKP